MKAETNVTGNPGDIELLKSNLALTGMLPIESEKQKDDGSLIWIINTFGETERNLLKQLSRKTPSLQYRLNIIKNSKK